MTQYIAKCHNFLSHNSYAASQTHLVFLWPLSQHCQLSSPIPWLGKPQQTSAEWVSHRASPLSRVDNLQSHVPMLSSAGAAVVCRLSSELLECSQPPHRQQFGVGALSAEYRHAVLLWQDKMRVLFLSMEGNYFTNSLLHTAEIENRNHFQNVNIHIHCHSLMQKCLQLPSLCGRLSLHETSSQCIKTLIAKNYKEIFYVVKLQLIVLLLEPGQFIHILDHSEN